MRRNEAELARIRQLSAEEQFIHFARVDITENILNLRCPRCKTVFVDFTGCFALSCVYNQCGAAFCAWCLQDCGMDAHPHVTGCRDGNGTFHGSLEDFQRHHRNRRRRLVDDKLLGLADTQSREIMGKLRSLVEKDMRELP